MCSKKVSFVMKFFAVYFALIFWDFPDSYPCVCVVYISLIRFLVSSLCSFTSFSILLSALSFISLVLYILMTHLFIKQMSIGCLFCSTVTVNRTDENPCLHRTYILMVALPISWLLTRLFISWFRDGCRFYYFYLNSEISFYSLVILMVFFFSACSATNR